MWINGLMQFSVLCCVVLCWIIAGPNQSHSRPATALRWRWHTCIYTSSLCWVQDLKANESRLRDINKVASELESEGLMAEEAPVMQAQVPSAAEGSSPLHLHPPGWLLSLLFLILFLMLQQQEVLGSAPGKVHSLFIMATFCSTFDLWPLTRSRFVKALKWLTCFFRTGWSRFQGCISMEGDLLSSSHSLSILTMSVQSGVFWWIYCNDLTGPGNPRWPSQQLLHCSALAPVCRFKQGNLFWRLVVDFIPQRAN